MIELVLWLLLCNDPMDEFFPGYLPLPNPTEDEQVVIPIPTFNKKDEFNHDPIKTA